MNQKQSIAEAVEKSQNLQTPPVIEVNPLVLRSESTIDQILNSLGYFVIRIDESPISNKDELLKALARNCQIPDYFGFNWDALTDSLLDFHWHPAQGYVFMFKNPEYLNKADLKVFLDIIQDVSTGWVKDDIPFKLLVPQGSIDIE